MATYNDLVDGLGSLVVSGVTRRFEDGPPAKLNAADLPAQWVQMPTGEDAPISVAETWPVRRAELVIAVEAVGQSTNPANFAATVDLMDALSSALEGFSLGTIDPQWDIRLDGVLVAGNAYWAAIAEVTVSG
ncbi:MAG TPA: hypothetical protein ENJ31_01620 [Anaerolineae bacterium]|nr:hypothetical protein [Anaerolineae bacterium]